MGPGGPREGQHPRWVLAGQVPVACTQYGSLLPCQSIPVGQGAGPVSAPRQMHAAASKAGGQSPSSGKPPWTYACHRGARIRLWQQGGRLKQTPISHPPKKLAFLLPNVFQMGIQRKNSPKHRHSPAAPHAHSFRVSPPPQPHAEHPQNPEQLTREQKRHPSEDRQGWKQATAFLTCRTLNPAWHKNPLAAMGRDGWDSARHRGDACTGGPGTKSPLVQGTGPGGSVPHQPWGAH